MLTRSKLKLMTQFQWGVVAYVASFAVVLVLPLLVYSPEPGEYRPEQESLALRVFIILQNAVLWLFLAGLCFIFRYVLF